RFLDFSKFKGIDVEQKAIKFCGFAKSKSQEEVEDLVIRFVLFQKERIDRQDKREEKNNFSYFSIGFPTVLAHSAHEPS
ncbi:MAG TPA: hypothetical protein VFY68_10880, partial [Nitrososphaeraceae archaeon]|nr:hypothetical protein [Nitrososphaeraceae archaeon]